MRTTDGRWARGLHLVCAFAAAVRALSRGDEAGADEGARPDAPTSEPAASPA